MISDAESCGGERIYRALLARGCGHACLIRLIGGLAGIQASPSVSSMNWADPREERKIGVLRVKFRAGWGWCLGFVRSLLCDHTVDHTVKLFKEETAV